MFAFCYRKEILECFTKAKTLPDEEERKRPPIPLIEKAKKVVRTYYEDQVNSAIEKIKVMYMQTHHKQLNFH